MKLLLEFKKANLLVRDVDGSPPLHSAVRQGFAEIVQLLIEAGPAEALLAENGVGETPLETASLQEIVERTRQQFNPSVSTPLDLDSLEIRANPERFNIQQQESEITKLRNVIDELLHDGRMRKNTKLPNELMSFANKMDVKLATAKKTTIPEEKEWDDGNAETDNVDRLNTLVRVRKGLLPLGGPRGLVHLIDVQRSIQETLGLFQQEAANSVRKTYDDGLEPEVDDDEALRSNGQVYAFVSITKDQR